MQQPYGALFDAVCRIQTPTGSGTGFALSKGDHTVPGVMLTCNHVIENAPGLTVSWWTRGYQEARATVAVPSVLVQDFSRDIALVEVPGLEREPLKVVEDALWPGDEFHNVGYPLGRQYPRFVKGIASGWDFFDIDGIEQRIIVLDGTVHCGQSGGPICNGKGEVSALVYAKQLAPGVDPRNASWTTLGIGLAVPLEGLETMIEAGRAMKYKVTTGPIPDACIADRASLARLQHWLISEGGTPVAEMSCNFREEVWVRKKKGAKVPVPRELRDAVAPMVTAYLQRRSSGGRFMFNGRVAYAFDPADGAYTPLVELRSVASGREPWTAAR